MRDIRVGTAQFEHRDGDKPYNLERVRALAEQAAQRGAEIVCFHECCLTGYTFLQTLSHQGLDGLAERVPEGPSTQDLIEVSRSLGTLIGAGLIEREPGGTLRNCYVVVGPDGLLARHHKLHPFIHPSLKPGERYTLFDWKGIRFAVLTCYDNNLPENPRACALLGAEVVLAPHVTGCTPSTMPGRGLVDRALWDNRERDPARLRLEFDGPKGRSWLMRWLPARAWENGLGIVFSNNVGVDHDTIKPGLAMVLDPHGEIVVESRALGDDVVVGMLTAAGYATASGRRYIQARRPSLYGPLVAPKAAESQSSTKPGWALAYEDQPLP